MKVETVTKYLKIVRYPYIILDLTSSQKYVKKKEEKYLRDHLDIPSNTYIFQI